MIKLIFLGKTNEQYIQKGIDDYLKRIGFFYPVKTEILKGIKNKGKLSDKEQKIKEAEQIIKAIDRKDRIILLDEKGKQYTSKEFAGFIENQIQTSAKNIVFIIGGPFGVADEIKEKATEIVSLSKMTFSHQLTRLLFLEQLYRAFTIIRGMPYHHS